jgi:hypothetical protein
MHSLHGVVHNTFYDCTISAAFASLASTLGNSVKSTPAYRIVSKAIAEAVGGEGETVRD